MNDAPRAAASHPAPHAPSPSDVSTVAFADLSRLVAGLFVHAGLGQADAAMVADSLAELKARGFRVYVADLAEPSFTPENVPVDGPLALVFGSETRGVSDTARSLADGVLRVPMHGLTESLNVSVSAAIALRGVAERRRTLVGNDLSAEEKARFYNEWLESEERAARGYRARTAPILS